MVQISSWATLVQAGVNAHSDIERAQWVLGDLALQVETVFGEHTLQQYTNEVGVEYEQLRRYRQTAAAYQNPLRSGHLSWSHHYVMATRPDRLEWLAKAVEHGWSTRKLQQEIQLVDNPPRPKDLIPQVQARVAAGENPHDVAWDVVRTYGPLPPATARELAHVTGSGLIPGTDNRLHSGQPLEVIERAAQEAHRHGQLFAALEHLATKMEPPEREVLCIPDYSRARVDNYLDVAIKWLMDFQRRWREQR